MTYEQYSRYYKGKICAEGASRYDIRIGEGGGGHGKVDVVREVA